MITIQSFTFNDFQENTYVLFDETQQCVIVDPGCYASSEQKILVDFISTHQLTPVKLLNTHCHIDHIWGNNFVADNYRIALYLHQQELITYKETAEWAVLFGLAVQEIPDTHFFITDKDIITFGSSKLQIALTPGHSIASLSFYNLEEKFCIAGDTLFKGTIGRTDLPHGNYETLIQSIKEKMMIWPDDMRIYSGHGIPTTIGEERLENPFLQD